MSSIFHKCCWISQESALLPSRYESTFLSKRTRWKTRLYRLESLSSPTCELELWEGWLLRWVKESNRSVPAFSLWKMPGRLSHANQLAQVCPGNQLCRNNLKRLTARKWYSLCSGKWEHFERPKSGSVFCGSFYLCVGSQSSWGSTLLPRGWRRNSTRKCGHRDTWQWSMSDQRHPTNGIPKRSLLSPL